MIREMFDYVVFWATRLWAQHPETLGLLLSDLLVWQFRAERLMYSSFSHVLYMGVSRSTRNVKGFLVNYFELPKSNPDSPVGRKATVAIGGIKSNFVLLVTG